MQKLWFKTKNDQIVDLNSINCMYVQKNDLGSDTPKFSVCISSCDWAIGEFDTKEEAQQYLDEIYKLLKGEND